MGTHAERSPRGYLDQQDQQERSILRQAPSPSPEYLRIRYRIENWSVVRLVVSHVWICPVDSAFRAAENGLSNYFKTEVSLLAHPPLWYSITKFGGKPTLAAGPLVTIEDLFVIRVHTSGSNTTNVYQVTHPPIQQL